MMANATTIVVDDQQPTTSSADLLDDNKTRRRQRSKTSDDCDSLFDCSYCGDHFEPPVVVLNACCHRFCRRCLVEHLNVVYGDRRCPECEEPLGDDESRIFTVDVAFTTALSLTSDKSLAKRYVRHVDKQPADKNAIEPLSSFDDIDVVLVWGGRRDLVAVMPPAAFKTRHLRVPSDATIDHLRRFLFIRVETEARYRLEPKYGIMITQPAEMTTRESRPNSALAGTVDLRLLADERPNQQKPLELQFRIFELPSEVKSAELVQKPRSSLDSSVA